MNPACPVDSRAGENFRTIRKKIRVLLSAGLALLFLGASAGHQAFGPLRFGMPTATARTAHKHITQSFLSHRRDSLTAADVRAQFVTNGSLRIARNAALEAALLVNFSYKAEPFVTEVTVTARSKKAEEYATDLRQAWEILQDIGDGKFTRKEPRGQLPPIAVLSMDNPVAAKGSWAELVTDTWECEGIQIELVVRMLPPSPEGFTPVPRTIPVYYACLRATEATVAK